MKHRGTAIGMVVGAMLSACGMPAQVDLGAERDALRAAAAAYHAAAEARDTSAIAGLYGDAALVLPPGEAAAAGMAAVREFVTEFAATPGFAVSVDDTDMTVEVGAGGDMGYTLANVKVSVTGPNGTPVEQSFRDFHLWEKQDGEWRLAVDIWNSEPLAGAAADSVTSDRVAISAIRQQEQENFTAGNRAAMTSLFTNDAVIMPPNEPAFQGTTAMDAWLASLYQEASVEATYIDTDLTVTGDLAYETLAFMLTLTPTDGSESTTEAGKGLHIYEHQDDGSWKIAVDIWNTDN